MALARGEIALAVPDCETIPCPGMCFSYLVFSASLGFAVTHPPSLVGCTRHENNKEKERGKCEEAADRGEAAAGSGLAQRGHCSGSRP